MGVWVSGWIELHTRWSLCCGRVALECPPKAWRLRACFPSCDTVGGCGAFSTQGLMEGRSVTGDMPLKSTPETSLLPPLFFASRMPSYKPSLSTKHFCHDVLCQARPKWWAKCLWTKSPETMSQNKSFSLYVYLSQAPFITEESWLPWMYTHN